MGVDLPYFLHGFDRHRRDGAGHWSLGLAFYSCPEIKSVYCVSAGDEGRGTRGGFI